MQPLSSMGACSGAASCNQQIHSGCWKDTEWGIYQQRAKTWNYSDQGIQTSCDWQLLVQHNKPISSDITEPAWRVLCDRNPCWKIDKISTGTTAASRFSSFALLTFICSLYTPNISNEVIGKHASAISPLASFAPCLLPSFPPFFVASFLLARLLPPPPHPLRPLRPPAPTFKF